MQKWLRWNYNIKKESFSTEIILHIFLLNRVHFQLRKKKQDIKESHHRPRRTDTPSEIMYISGVAHHIHNCFCNWYWGGDILHWGIADKFHRGLADILHWEGFTVCIGGLLIFCIEWGLADILYWEGVHWYFSLGGGSLMFCTGREFTDILHWVGIHRYFALGSLIFLKTEKNNMKKKKMKKSPTKGFERDSMQRIAKWIGWYKCRKIWSEVEITKKEIMDASIFFLAQFSFLSVHGFTTV